MRGATTLGNGGSGIYINNSNNNAIGGTGSGQGNTIAYNANRGILIDSGSGNGIRQNSIFSNAQLGIDLAPGANNNQTAPVLSSVQTLSSNIKVTGTLTSRPNTNFTLEFFANTASGASGKFFLGSLGVRTNANGVASFVYTGPLPPSGATFITSTATDPSNNSSEFSNAVS